MNKAIEILKQEISQRKLALTIKDNLMVKEITEELNSLEKALTQLENPGIPIIKHFVDDFGHRHSLLEDDILTDYTNGEVKFYIIDYDYERVYLTPIFK